MSSSPAPFVYTDDRFHLTANWITSGRVPLLIPMVYFYLHQQWVAGGICFGLSIGLDGADGPWARRQQAKLDFVLTRAQQKLLTWWQLLNFPGNTPFGDEFDPFIDKLSNILAIICVGPLWLPWWIIYLVIAIELVLQFGVRPLQQRYDVKSAANKFGKLKTNFFGWGIGAMPFVYVWGVGFLFYLVVILGLLAACGSVYYHLMPVVAAIRRQRAG